MTGRFLVPAFADQSNYDTLIAEALVAFEHDIMYAVQVVESARSLTKKKTKSNRRERAV